MAPSSSTAWTISGNALRRVVVADDHVAGPLMRRDEGQLPAHSVVGVLGVEEREVDPREAELLERDVDVAAEEHDVILDEVRPRLEQLEPSPRPVRVGDAVPVDRPLGVQDVDGQDRPGPPRMSRSACAMQIALNPRAVPVSKIVTGRSEGVRRR